MRLSNPSYFAADLNINNCQSDIFIFCVDDDHYRGILRRDKGDSLQPFNSLLFGPNTDRARRQKTSEMSQ